MAPRTSLKAKEIFALIIISLIHIKLIASLKLILNMHILIELLSVLMFHREASFPQFCITYLLQINQPHPTQWWYTMLMIKLLYLQTKTPLSHYIIYKIILPLWRFGIIIGGLRSIKLNQITQPLLLSSNIIQPLLSSILKFHLLRLKNTSA